jgi:hypothetical protein
MIAAFEDLSARTYAGCWTLLEWRPLYAEPDADSSDMATKVMEALRESTAGQAVSCWVAAEERRNCP